MRAIPVASAALLGVGALASCAPGAVAGHGDHYVMSVGYDVVPSTVAPGGQVTLLVDRDTSGCRGRVVVSSDVFDAVTVAPRASRATARVDRDALPGAVYRVTFTCGSLGAVKDLTIAGGRASGSTPFPRGVHAGGGGSSAGLDLGDVALGTVLVAGSVGTAYRLSRRRTGERGV
ncbi:hypothetical protein [Streptomyces griseus]|uniref:hypothetical protein n=1 Tax=Streptomyces griseus TaxID=1911 RepID=UPI00056CC56E|nr:hypothetical protein [Streptomyces griseus]